MRQKLLICLALAGITLAVFWSVTSAGFINYDDPDYVRFNPPVENGLTRAGVEWAFTTGHTGNWHPVTWLSHMLDCQFYGLKPGGHHLTNLLFHTVNALLLFGVLRQMTGAVWRSALVAALFAWHPLHVESVAWISERKDVLSAFFWLLTMWAYTRYAQESKTGPSGKGGQKSRGCYCLALVFLALGLMSKPMLVTLPFVLLLLDYWPLGRMVQLSNLRPLLLEKIPFLALAIASSIVTYRVQDSGGAVASLDVVPLSQRIANTPISYFRYLRKTIWPVDLAAFYPAHNAWPTWQVAGAVLLLVAVTIAVAAQWRRRPWFLVGWLWFLGTLVPVIGLVQVGKQAMADRYSYIPLIGIFVMLAWALGELANARPWGRLAAGATTALALAACVTLTWFQAQTWQNPVTVFSQAIKVTSDNLEAENLLGMDLERLGKFDEAFAHFNTALQMDPHSADTLYNLGAGCALQEKLPEALDYLQRALQYQPTLAKTHLTMAGILAHQGNLDDAAFHYTEALRTEPGNADTHKRYGLVLAKQKKVDEAIAQFNEAVRLEPGDAEAHYDLGLALLVRGNRDAARQCYRQAVQLKPDWPLALNDLAWLLATDPKPEMRGGPEAVQLAERACDLTKRKEASFLGTLDAAYAAAGRFQEAIATAEETQKAACAANAPDLAQAAAKRLDLYRAGQSFHY